LNLIFIKIIKELIKKVFKSIFFGVTV